MLHRTLWLALALALVLATNLSACSDDGFGNDCKENTDCPVGFRCLFNRCEESTVPVSDVTKGADLVMDGDVIISGPCSGVPPVGDQELLINEVHAAVATGEQDTNCDGLSDAGDDEFVEIVNNAQVVLDLTGVQVAVNGTAKFSLSGCLQPGRGMVVYGGGAANCDNLGGTRTLVSDKNFTFSNSGGQVSLLGRSGDVLAQVSFPSLSTSRASYTRSPDFTGEFVKHNTVSATKYSAGLCVNGEELLRGCMPATPADTTDVQSDVIGDATDTAPDVPIDVPPPCDPPGLDDLVLNELLYDPAPASVGGGDANCDGAVSATADEFIEVVNRFTADVNLKGVSVQVNGSSKHSFSQDLCLAPGQALLVFGGGSPQCAEFSDALLVTSSLGLTNASATVTILDATGTPFTDGTASWASATLASDQSLQRNPDLSSGTGFIAFTTVPSAGTRRQSPGTCADGQAFSTGCP